MVPRSAQELLKVRREGRWAELRAALDWTRYHLQVAMVEGGGAGRSRVAAGLFERIAQFHSCAGAMPVEALSTSSVPAPLDRAVAERLHLAEHWTGREVAEADAACLHWYDVVVCIDAQAAETLSAKVAAAGLIALPSHVVQLGDFGAYLELRRSESPIKAWVPDWRAKLDPDYDQRQEEAEAPQDDALAVWHSMPDDLARLVQPRYIRVAGSLTADEACGVGAAYGGDEDAAVLAFHIGGLVRFLMDSYPLDLHGGPGYIPP